MAVRVEIYERTIVAHFTPGGIVYRNGSKLGSRAQGMARLFAPARSGYLRTTITHGIRPGRLHTLVNLHAGALYAPFVEHGTVGPITPTHSPYMPIPAYRQYKAFRAEAVSGQRGQHYLSRGMNRALTSLGYGSFPEYL